MKSNNMKTLDVKNENILIILNQVWPNLKKFNYNLKKNRELTNELPKKFFILHSLNIWVMINPIIIKSNKEVSFFFNV